MKTIYERWEEEKKTKVRSHSGFTALFCIAMCVVVLCSMTYAWFVGKSSSDSNTLATGTFALKEIKVHNQEQAKVDVSPDATQAGVYTCVLPTAGTYTVTLELADDATVRGYCIVRVGNKVQRTATLIGDNTANNPEEIRRNPLTFTITVTEETTVAFEPKWGTVENPEINENTNFQP